MLLSRLEHAGEFLLQGWALHEGDFSITVCVDIHINGNFTARIPAGTFRSDLKAIGYGSGHHSFFFNPLDYLNRRENLIEVRESSSSTLLQKGSQVVKSELATDREAYRRATLRAQSQWARLPAAEQTRDCETPFLKHLELAAHFHPGLRILEIGTGSGELLAAILGRGKLFSSYLGLDLSRTRIDTLHREFATDRIRFLAGDAARYPISGQFDLLIASSVCSKLFPSFLPAFRNACRALQPGGIAAFDLVVQDNRISISRAEWQNDRWLRLYSEREIRRLLTDVGLELLELRIYARSEEEHRVFVSALKLHPHHQNHFENV